MQLRCPVQESPDNALISRLLMITGGIAPAGCNTIEGMGRDIKSVGDEVADATD